MITSDQRAEYERNILSNIDTHGWFCASVFDPQGHQPNFSYTVGFTRTLDHPELFLAGLPMELTHSILWAAHDQIKAGNRPVPGEPWHEILDGYDMVCRAVDDSNKALEYLHSANWFWREVEGHQSSLPALQLFWPSGETRRFPWDEGCEADVIAAQPRLDLAGQAFG
ncbi:MAG: DUF4262 domain-containing protein [Alphaproteobacteria bacterium]|nr:DUF4262 domain-containing protein [Alphaproteobacteria bacterium]